jgi:hypothetical protein
MILINVLASTHLRKEGVVFFLLLLLLLLLLPSHMLTPEIKVAKMHILSR